MSRSETMSWADESWAGLKKLNSVEELPVDLSRGDELPELIPSSSSLISARYSIKLYLFNCYAINRCEKQKSNILTEVSCAETELLCGVWWVRDELNSVE